MRGVTVTTIAAAAAGKFSEDAWGSVGDANYGAAWMLDGATGLGDRQYISGAYSDAAWYANEFSKALHQHSLWPVAAREVFSTALRQMAKSWQEQVNETVPRYALPSAAGIWVRWQDGEMECVSLGDCRGWLLSEDNQLTQLGLLDEDPNDAWLAKQIAAHQENGIGAEDMRAKVMVILREARASMNTPGGYPIFSVHSDICGELPVRKLKLWEGNIILCSDGLFRWSDVLHQGNAHEFAGACIHDISHVLNHVRELEKADPDCMRYTRLKRHDDATGIVLRVE